MIRPTIDLPPITPTLCSAARGLARIPLAQPLRPAYPLAHHDRSRQPRPPQRRRSRCLPSHPWRAIANDVHRRRAGRPDACTQRLLGHAADYGDGDRVDADRHPDFGLHGAPWPPRRFYRGHHGRRTWRHDQRLRALPRLVRAVRDRRAVFRHLYVGAGLLPLCRCRQPRRMRSAPRRFPW